MTYSLKNLFRCKNCGIFYGTEEEPYYLYSYIGIYIYKSFAVFILRMSNDEELDFFIKFLKKEVEKV